MSEVVLSELAETDLTDIWVFVAQDNAEAADRLLDHIHEKCQFLAGSPKAGRQRSELDPSIRSFAVGNYVVFYRERPTASKSLAYCTAAATSRLFSVRERRAGRCFLIGESAVGRAPEVTGGCKQPYTDVYIANSGSCEPPL